jgi:hypothetical protein
VNWQGADDIWRNAGGEAKQELNMLASLIGQVHKPTGNFKINLFPEANNNRSVAGMLYFGSRCKPQETFLKIGIKKAEL